MYSINIGWIQCNLYSIQLNSVQHTQKLRIKFNFREKNLQQTYCLYRNTIRVFVFE
jgi:hypothetical protein